MTSPVGPNTVGRSAGEALGGAARETSLRAPRLADAAWLLRSGLAPELAGVQYSRPEIPLQLLVAPLRALLAPFVAAAIIELEGRRVGYIGRSPLSGNYEYWLEPEARGGGRGRSAIATFLARHRTGDRARIFFVSSKNDRSRRALEAAFAALGWHEGRDWGAHPVRFGTAVWVRPAPPAARPHRTRPARRS